jgi:undecaprenyl-diphosphatase
MTLFKILILAIVQGAAELLPVSSSAHVIVAEKMMGLDPTTPEMTLLLVMLHTGTMFAVIFYFWTSWKKSFFASRSVFWNASKLIAIATIITGVIGLTLKALIEKFLLSGIPHAEIELIFGNLLFISIALAAVGVLIILAGWKIHRQSAKEKSMGTTDALLIGAAQGLCLPFRGFSRSGATISTGLLLSISKRTAEEFSFALAVVLTPPVIVREVWRLLKSYHSPSLDMSGMAGLFYPSLLGMALSFLSGILALKWLSRWLERGRWHFFGIYCLFASVVVYLFHTRGL